MISVEENEDVCGMIVDLAIVAAAVDVFVVLVVAVAVAEEMVPQYFRQSTPHQYPNWA